VPRNTLAGGRGSHGAADTACATTEAQNSSECPIR
jgi:hypothetical protein